MVFFNRVPYTEISDMISASGATTELGLWGCSEIPAGEDRGRSPLRKSLGSKEHLDWVKIDINTVEIIIVQD